MADDPLTKVDDVVLSALRDFRPLADLVPDHLIQAWEEPADLRGTLEAVPAARLRLDPAADEAELAESSGEVSIERRYLIWFGTGRVQREAHNRVYCAVIAAIVRLFLGLDANGDPLSADTAPLRIERVSVGPSDPDVEPLAEAFEDADRRPRVAEFTDAIELRVLCMGDRAAFVQAILDM